MLRDDCSRTSQVLLLKLWILSQIFLRRKRAFTGWFYRVASSPSETSSWRCCHLCPQRSALPETVSSSPSSFPRQSRAGRPGTWGPCLHVPHRTAEGADRQALAGWSQITKGKKKRICFYLHIVTHVKGRGELLVSCAYWLLRSIKITSKCMKYLD